MKTILVPTNNNGAYKLLQKLEKLAMVKLIKKKIAQPIKLSEKYRGVFSLEDAKSFNEHIQLARKEWEPI
jgi:hypothetical protein